MKNALLGRSDSILHYTTFRHPWYLITKLLLKLSLLPLAICEILLERLNCITFKILCGMVDLEPAGSKLAPDLSKSLFLCLQFLRVQRQTHRHAFVGG